MGRLVVRVGDINSAGGVAVQGHRNITVNGRLAAKQGSIVLLKRRILAVDS
jgi:uncharacterized Zn-binding protein involved in type VI secretion